MSNKPIHYVLKTRTARLGKNQGKEVLQAVPTGRDRVSFRNICEEVADNTTFAPEEVAAVINLLTKTAKRHVENGDIVELGDLGTLSPSFKSIEVAKTDQGDSAFNANLHITKPTVRFAPNRKYFELRGVSFERSFPKQVKVKAGATSSSGTGSSSSAGGGSSTGVGTGGSL